MKPFLSLLVLFLSLPLHAEGWIRHNQLGYLPHATKVAVYMGDTAPESFQLIDAYTGKIVFESAAKPTGPLGRMGSPDNFRVYRLKVRC